MTVIDVLLAGLDAIRDYVALLVLTSHIHVLVMRLGVTIDKIICVHRKLAVAECLWLKVLAASVTEPRAAL